MNIILKIGKTFTDEKTGQVHSSLFGGMKLMNLSIEAMTLNFQVKFFGSKEAMTEGKQEIFKETFSIADIEGDKEAKIEEALNLSKMLIAKPKASTIKETIEIELYNHIISLDKYTDFEIV